MARLRDVRLRRLLSVRALAKRAAVAPSTVHLIETGRRAPQLLTIHRLSQALGVDPAEIDEFRAALDDVTCDREGTEGGRPLKSKANQGARTDLTVCLIYTRVSSEEQARDGRQPRRAAD